MNLVALDSFRGARSCDVIEVALKTASEVLNVMERFYYKSVCSFEDTIDGDAPESI